MICTSDHSSPKTYKANLPGRSKWKHECADVFNQELFNTDTKEVHTMLDYMLQKPDLQQVDVDNIVSDICNSLKLAANVSGVESTSSQHKL